MIYSNIWKLLYDIKLNNGDDILRADSNSYYGWVCQKTEKMWQISMVNLNNSVKLGDSNSIIALRQYFISHKNFIKLLNDLPNLEKLNKLKAFW